MTAYPVKTGISHHISHCQHFEFHTRFLQTILWIIISYFSLMRKDCFLLDSISRDCYNNSNS